MTQVLQQGTRKARVHHQCYHCYRYIGTGELYGYQNNVFDSKVYTVRWHLDCDELAEKCRDLAGPCPYDDGEGWGPLRSEMISSAEYQNLITAYRGEYQHVICRMELTDQLRGLKWL